MRLFFQVCWTAIKQQMIYRTAMWAGLATNLFFGILRAAVMKALYAGQSEVNGLSLGGAVTFVGLTQALIAFTTIFGSWDVINSVYSGDISNDLTKPMNFWGYWLARDLGRSLVNLVARGLVFMGLYALFFPLQFPDHFTQWVGFVAALILGWLVSYSWRFLVNLSAFWTQNATGIGRGLFGLAQILSGFFIPLRLLPQWFSQACAFTPFPAMINTPVEIYLGVIQGSDMIRALGVQALWLGTMALICQLVYRAGLSKLVVQGG